MDLKEDLREYYWQLYHTKQLAIVMVNHFLKYMIFPENLFTDGLAITRGG